mmetsp:Transcript_49490/g.130796  ORF Transcript_49490/g.130796 Transcript_49490/m.130796 type:complete len:114 (+) Transcript_49490:86-427(+)
MFERGFCRLCQQSLVVGQFVSDEEFRCAACVDEHGQEPGPGCLRHPSHSDAFEVRAQKRSFEEVVGDDKDAHPAAAGSLGKRHCADAKAADFSTPAGRRVLQHLIQMQGKEGC